MKPVLIISPTVLAAKLLLEQGMSNPQIANRLGVSPQYVSQIRYRLSGKKKRPEDYKAHAGTDRVPITLGCRDLEVLAAKAAEREIKAATLIRRLVEAIVKDDLIDAVLDDGHSSQPAMQAAE